MLVIRLIRENSVIGMMPGINGTLMSQLLVPVAEIEKSLVGIKQLRVDGVGAGLDLPLEVFEVGLAVGTFLVLFRIAGDADSDLRMPSTDQRHQLVRVAEIRRGPGERRFRRQADRRAEP